MDAAGRVVAESEAGAPSLAPSGQPVSWLRGIGRGLSCRCPACGRGRLFAGFLKVRDRCEDCGQELHHHRADDLPPYVIIFIVGHVVGTGILLTELDYDLPLALVLTLWPLVGLVLCLALLQPVKGAVVGLQYALGMHGFGAEAKVGPKEGVR